MPQFNEPRVKESWQTSSKDHAYCRAFLNEYYKTDFFTSFDDQLRPSVSSSERRGQSVTSEDDPARSMLATPRLELRTSDRYGSAPKRRPWEPDSVHNHPKRTGTYVGLKPDLCPLKLLKHKWDWNPDTAIPKEKEPERIFPRF